MCDYSLEMYKTVDAQQGATYQTHRFPTGTIGVIDPAKPVVEGITDLCAVCIKDRTVVMIGDETGVFARIDPPAQEGAYCNRHRDGIRYSSGRSVSLQDVPIGTPVKIVLLATDAPEDASLATPEAVPAE